MDSFDLYADQYPTLIDLVGIASQMQLTDSLTRKVALRYMGSIVKRLDVPHDYIICEIGKVMGLNDFLEVTAC